MFDLGFLELLVIGVVALIVVGPKDLPILFRKVGEFVGKARGMAREFSRAMDEAADEAGIKETAKSLKAVADPKQLGLDKISEATADLKDEFTGWDPESETAKLSAERQEAKRKILEAAENRAAAREAEAVRAKDAADAAAKPKKSGGKKKAAKSKATAKSGAKSGAKPAAKSGGAKSDGAKTAKKPASKPATKTAKKNAAPKAATKSNGAPKPTAPETPAKGDTAGEAKA